MTRPLDLVSLGYVMDRLGLSKAHVLSLVKAGAIPSHQIRPGPTGRAMWVFEAQDIELVQQWRHYLATGQTRYAAAVAAVLTRVRQQRSRRAG